MGGRKEQGVVIMVVHHTQYYYTVSKYQKFKAYFEIALLCLIVMALSACTTSPPSSPKNVDTPVVVDTPEPQVFVLPELPIKNLTNESKKHPDEVVKAYAATIELLKGEVKARDLALKPYRKTP